MKGLTPLQTTPAKEVSPVLEQYWEGSLRGVRGALPLSRIFPLPLNKGKGIKGIGLLRINGGTPKTGCGII